MELSSAYLVDFIANQTAFSRIWWMRSGIAEQFLCLHRIVPQLREIFKSILADVLAGIGVAVMDLLRSDNEKSHIKIGFLVKFSYLQIKGPKCSRSSFFLQLFAWSQWLFSTVMSLSVWWTTSESFANRCSWFLFHDKWPACPFARGYGQPWEYEC